ncbi:phage portal protein [Undibacterium aquatile]|uniref:Phage portal protein n=1 Tax=Undibacterium aquatile TaxID=1537398 RepID=A0ABR6XEL3_9BURK|nr:phage portal protein [Undibacterium aquatile]MBC3811340.1 phage portal protein [Undibacterium aquatile]
MTQTKQKPIGRIKASVLQWLGVPISLTNGEFWDAWLSGSNWSGQRVTVDSALQLSTAMACVRLIAETISTLPLGFFEKLPDGTRKTAVSHPLYEILHSQPNADMSAVTFWEVVLASMLLWGAAYIEIRRIGTRIVALDFLLPEKMQRPRRNRAGEIEFWYTNPDGTRRQILESDMMHLPAFSVDGISGISPIAYGANVFGSAMATDRASAETFKDAMRSPGIVTMDSVLKPDQREDIRKHVDKVSKTGGVMVLEKGAGFHQLTFNPADAQLLSSRQFNVEEICRWFRVPPFMVGHAEKSTTWGTGIEQQMIAFLTFVLRPWCVRIEQGVRKSLLNPVERNRYFSEFAMEGLLRADSAARASFYSAMTQNGIFTRDDCRILENRPPMGGNAAVLTVQSNMMPIDLLGQKTDSAAAKDALNAWLNQSPKGNE